MVSSRGGCESPSIITPTRKGGAWGTGTRLEGACVRETRAAGRCQKLATAAVSVGHVSNMGSNRAISNARVRFGRR